MFHPSEQYATPLGLTNRDYKFPQFCSFEINSLKMKFPSIRLFWLSIKQTFLRFPLETLIIIIAMLTGCYMNGIGNNSLYIQEVYLLKFLTLCNLSFTSLLASDLYVEANQLTAIKRWGIRLIVLFICTILFFGLKPFYYTEDIFRIGLLVTASHLLVSFAPFTKRGNLNGFWQFNKLLLIRILSAVLCIGILLVGLLIALSAAEFLFAIHIDQTFYITLSALITTGGASIFFLSGIPKDFKSLDQVYSYPKSLTIFTQYVLIPLMTIYLAILLVYELKILIDWKFPKGLVSMFILGYSSLGLFSLFLVYPIRKEESKGWIKLFSKFFYMMMIPLIILLILAVWKRISDYGITESRYILAMITIWLTIITIYFLTSKAQNIKIIPISLCILILLAVYGPQSAFSIAEHAQVNRLKKLISTKKDNKQQIKIIDYLVTYKGLKSLQPFTRVNLTELETNLEKGKQSEYIKLYWKTDTAYALLNINRNILDSPERNRFTFVPANGDLIKNKGYDYVLPIGNNTGQYEGKLDGITMSTANDYDDIDGIIILKLGKDLQVRFDLNQLARLALLEYKKGKLKQDKETDNYYLPDSFFKITRQSGPYEITYMATAITIDGSEKGIMSSTGNILIRIK
jgi:hypothetical protein